MCFILTLTQSNLLPTTSMARLGFVLSGFPRRGTCRGTSRGSAALSAITSTRDRLHFHHLPTYSSSSSSASHQHHHISSESIFRGSSRGHRGGGWASSALPMRCLQASRLGSVIVTAALLSSHRVGSSKVPSAHTRSRGPSSSRQSVFVSSMVSSSAASSSSSSRLVAPEELKDGRSGGAGSGEVAAQGGRPPVSRKPGVIFVLGGPGSGKGTQCKRLADEFG